MMSLAIASGTGWYELNCMVYVARPWVRERRSVEYPNISESGSSQVIRAQVPLSDMFGYATDRRSKTQGRATYTMQFHSYQEVPENISREIIARIRGE